MIIGWFYVILQVKLGLILYPKSNVIGPLIVLNLHMVRSGVVCAR